METLVDSPLKGPELMKACLAIEPDLNTALDLILRISTERKFRETCKLTFRSLGQLDKHIQKLDLKDPDAFREKVLTSAHSIVSEAQGYQRHWLLQALKELLCCSSVCQSTPPTEQK